jgi:hypothetical protein
MKLSRVALISGWIACAVVSWFAFDDDVQRAYPSPEDLDGVSILAPSAAAAATPRVPHDFDGDGIPDFFWVEYFHMEPLFRASTSGLLKVYSGENHSTLAALTVDTPICRVSWCGDVDHNGTDDLLVPGHEQRLVVLAAHTTNRR